MPSKSAYWDVICKFEHHNSIHVWSLSVLSMNECQNGFRVWSAFGLYQKFNLNEYQNGVRVWSVSELYLKIKSEWVSEWRPCLEHIWIVSVRCSEWVSEWRPSLERIWTVSKGWIWMSIRMASVSGAYPSCIMIVRSEWVIKWLPCLECIFYCIWNLWILLMIYVNLILKRVKC